MAEKLGTSILESRLGALKKDFAGVKKMLDELNDAAGSFGTNLRQSIGAASSELRGLESGLKGVETQLKRMSSTGSAIGAANVSASLGQLTGQGRTHGGGGGGYGGGYGGSAGRLGPLGGLAEKAIGGAAPGWLKTSLGALWGAARLSYGTREKWEQAGRYTRGLKYGTKEAQPGVTFGGLSALGVSQFEGAGLSRNLQAQTGYMISRGGGEAANIFKLAHATGITPDEYMGDWSQARMGGMTLPQSFSLSARLQNQTRARAAASGLRGNEQTVRASYIQRQYMRGMRGLRGMQIGATGRISDTQTQKMQNLIGTLHREGGPWGDQPGVAAEMANALGRGTAAPGGGEAGKLFMMRAAGFGNPMLKEYQRAAADMGISPDMFKRRGFLESKYFLEDDPVKRIQAMMVGVRAEYGRGRGPGRQGAGILALEAMLGKEGVTYTQSRDLMALANDGAFTDANIRKIIPDVISKKFAKGQGVKIEGPTQPAQQLVTAQQAAFEEHLIQLGPAITNFGEAVNSVQIATLNGLTGAMTDLSTAMGKADGKDLAKIITAPVEIAAAAVRKVSKEYATQLKTFSKVTNELMGHITKLLQDLIDAMAP